MEVQYNQNIVEVYYNSKRIASHHKSQGKGVYVTNIKHMPQLIKHIANVVGVFCKESSIHRTAYGSLYRATITSIQLPEKGYKQAQGILAFKKHYGALRLENACKRAFVYSRSQYGTIETILKKRTGSTTSK